MKNKTIGGNMAASPKPTISSPIVTQLNSAANAAQPHKPGQLQFDYVVGDPELIEPLVTKKTLCEHYHIALRTLDYAISIGLPKVPVGRHVRFRFSEVQRWFEQNGCRRFATEGRKAAIQKALLKSRQFQFALPGEVQVTNEKNKHQKDKTKTETPNAKSKTSNEGSL